MLKRTALLIYFVILAVTWGCGGSSGTKVRKKPTPTPTLTATPTAAPTPLANTNSSLVAIDCLANTGYVGRALPDLITGDGAVEVLDLSVDPNVTNPHLTTIDLGSPVIPVSLAWDPNDSLIIVAAEQDSVDGSLYLIDEKTNTLVPGSPFPFPAGSNSGPTGGVVFDPIRDKVIVGTCNNNNTQCSLTQGDSFTGFTTFDIASKQFSPIISGLPPADNISLNWNTQVLMGASNTLALTTRALEALDGAHSALCTLNDNQLSFLQNADTTAFDPATNLLVVGNVLESEFIVINLNGATFNGSAPGCNLNEAGTLPNSALVPAKANYFGVSMNTRTHQAFMNDTIGNLTLVPLPAAPVVQLTSQDIGVVNNASLPNSPTGANFALQTLPYATTVDVCHNLGYVRGVDTLPDWQYLVQIDLAKLAATPGEISTPLNAGTCAGVVPPTATSCSNGQGVVYFPLPPS